MVEMSTYTFPFEKLEAWQDAKKLVIDIYATTKIFPDAEKFGLINQINRAAVSVASNLAEGSSRTSLKDQAYFSQLAYSSLSDFIVANSQLVIDTRNLIKRQNSRKKVNKV
jgi:four helix bundle protein